MAEGDWARPGDRDERGWVGRALVSLLVIVMIGAGVAAWQLDLVDRFSSDDEPDSPAAGPAAVPPPPGLQLPPVTEPPDVDSPLTPPGRIDTALVEAAMAPYLADPALGQHVVAAVADLTAPRPVVRVGDGVAAMPASVTKLLTSTAALSVLGPETRFSTRVLAGGKGRIVLVGGGDPFLASEPMPSAYPERADVVTLATETAAALRQQGRKRVQLGYDDSLFSEPSFNPAWPAHYLPEHVVSPITALWVDEGRPATGSGRVDDPSLYAAQTFAAALVAQGIEVVGTPRPCRVCTTAAAPSAKVPVPVTALPTWWDSTSAPSLSLTSSTRATISRTGADSTEASSRPPAATPWAGVPTTSMPWATSAAAKVCAAYSDGSSTRPEPAAGRPSSTHRAVIGETTCSGR